MISQLLKLASEDKDCEQKLAFVCEAMEDRDVGQDISDEIESLLGEVSESLEKNAGRIGNVVNRAKDFAKKPVNAALLGGAAASPLAYYKGKQDEKSGKDFYLGKTAGIFDAVKGGISSAGKAAKPYAGAAALGAASLVGSALVNDMYTSARLALSRNRNYKNMLEADPELKQHPAEKVKALFNTLHEKGGPEMSGDPLIASAFVKQQLELPPQFLLEQVHKLVGTGAALSKSRQMGSFDMGRIMGAGGGKQMASEAGKQIGKQMMSPPSGPLGIGGETCSACGSSDVTVSNVGGKVFKDCENCQHAW